MGSLSSSILFFDSSRPCCIPLGVPHLSAFVPLHVGTGSEVLALNYREWGATLFLSFTSAQLSLLLPENCRGTDRKEPSIVRNVQQKVREESDPAFCIQDNCFTLSFQKHVCVCKHTYVLCTSTCKAQILSIGEQNILMKMNNSANHPDVLATWCHAAG